MHCFNLRSHPYCRLAGYLEFERGLVVECNRHMAFVAGLGLDRAAFEEVSQFAVECHKKSFSCTVRRSIALLDCFFFGHVLALVERRRLDRSPYRSKTRLRSYPGEP